MSVFLVPAYRPVIRRTQIITRTVRSWPEGASQWLQDCFETTDWTIFSHQDLEVFTSAVLGYIQYCVNTATVDRQIRLFPNGKPCMNSEVRRLLWERNEAFRFGDREHFSAARAALKREIWEAKDLDSQEAQTQIRVAGVLLPLLSGVSSELWHLPLVLQLYSSREEAAPEGH